MMDLRLLQEQRSCVGETPMTIPCETVSEGQTIFQERITH